MTLKGQLKLDVNPMLSTSRNQKSFVFQFLSLSLSFFNVSMCVDGSRDTYQVIGFAEDKQLTRPYYCDLWGHILVNFIIFIMFHDEKLIQCLRVG